MEVVGVLVLEGIGLDLEMALVLDDIVLEVVLLELSLGDLILPRIFTIVLLILGSL